MCGRSCRPGPLRPWLAPDAETGDERTVPIDVVRLHVVEKAAPAADQLHETSPRVVITAVNLQMLGEVVDALCEERYLHFWRAGVGLV